MTDMHMLIYVWSHVYHVLDKVIFLMISKVYLSDMAFRLELGVFAVFSLHHYLLVVVCR